MKNKILILFMTISCVINAQGIEFFFKDMPQSLLPTLSSYHRLELLEYYKANKKDTLINDFGSTVKLLEFDTDNNYIDIQLNSIKNLKMFVFHTNDSTPVIGLIHTVCAPICSSYIRFYNKKWKQITVDMPQMSLKDFLEKEDKDLEKEVKTEFIELNFDPKEKQLLFINNSLEGLDINKSKEIDKKSLRVIKLKMSNLI